MKRTIMLFCALLLPVSAYAIPAGEFYERCKAASAKPEQGEDSKVVAQRLVTAGSCVGFVGGTLTGVNLLGNMMLKQNVIKTNLLCMPNEITPQVIYSETMKYIEGNDTVKKFPIEAAIFDLFTKKYPCKAEEKK